MHIISKKKFLLKANKKKRIKACVIYIVDTLTFLVKQTFLKTIRLNFKKFFKTQ